MMIMPHNHRKCGVMDRRKQKTRDSIRSAYIAMLTEHPDQRLTVTALAKRANIDRKTFYLHYDTIEDVMYDYARCMIDRLIELLRVQGFFEKPFEFLLFYQVLGIVVSENMGFFQHLATLPSMDFFWEQTKGQLADAVVALYRDRVALREDVLYVYVRFMLAGMQDVYRLWLLGKLRFSLEELGRMTGDAAFEGFSAVLK